MALKGQKMSAAEAKAKKKYNAKPSSKKDRAARNKARAEAIKDGRAKKGDGKDIDHKKKLKKGGSNAKSNTRVRNRSANRKDNGRSKKK